MKILPAIDIIGGKAVRLYRGDYKKMTVYSENVADFAKLFEMSGAKNLHVVDLDGALTGDAPNLNTVSSIISSTSLEVEVGGGVRSEAVAEKYIEAGARRVIIGTAAITDRPFLKRLIKAYGDRIAVGADIKDGFVAIRGWLEKSAYSAHEFFAQMCGEGVGTVICTDVSRDGAMQGTNLELYRELQQKFSVNIIASGGVSTLCDVAALSDMNLYGAIIGKAYYEGAIDLKEAIRIAHDY